MLWFLSENKSIWVPGQNESLPSEITHEHAETLALSVSTISIDFFPLFPILVSVAGISYHMQCRGEVFARFLMSYFSFNILLWAPGWVADVLLESLFHVFKIYG